MEDLFSHESYREYLNQYLLRLPKKGHGFRSRMAEAMKCEGSYVSRILKGQAQIQLEQAEALSRLLEHTDEELNFFLTMVLCARAGTPTLKGYFQRQLRQQRDHRLKLRNRIKTEQPLTIEHQARYYSHWEYAAVHMLLLIPELQDREALARHLRIPSRRLGRVLDFLVECGLAAREGARFKVGTAVLQLPGDSPLAQHNHVNWRQRAIQAIQADPDQGLHYTALLTMSAADAERVREIFIQGIEKTNRIVDQSGNERSVALLVDLFEI